MIKNYINVDINRVNVNINWKNEYIGTQSKVKEIKEEEEVKEEIKTPPSPTENLPNEIQERIKSQMIKPLPEVFKELDIWIVALSQLNRNDGNPYPTLGRLRWSGQIGEAADIVMFAYRPEYYSASKTYTDEFAEYTTRGTALIDVAKGRNIGTFRFLVKFDKQTTHFEQIEDMNRFLAVNDETFQEETRPF